MSLDKISIIFEMPKSIATNLINEVWDKDNKLELYLTDEEIEKIIKTIKKGRRVKLRYGG